MHLQGTTSNIEHDSGSNSQPTPPPGNRQIPNPDVAETHVFALLWLSRSFLSVRCWVSLECPLSPHSSCAYTHRPGVTEPTYQPTASGSLSSASEICQGQGQSHAPHPGFQHPMSETGARQISEHRGLAMCTLQSKSHVRVLQRLSFPPSRGHGSALVCMLFEPHFVFLRVAPWQAAKILRGYKTHLL